MTEKYRIVSVPVLTNPHGHTLTEIIVLSRLGRLGHVLSVPTHRLPIRSIFTRTGQGWKKWHGGQAMTWRSGIKELTSDLASVGVFHLPG